MLLLSALYNCTYVNTYKTQDVTKSPLCCNLQQQSYPVLLLPSAKSISSFDLNLKFRHVLTFTYSFPASEMTPNTHLYSVLFKCTPALAIKFQLPCCTVVAVKWHLRDFWIEPPPCEDEARGPVHTGRMSLNPHAFHVAELVSFLLYRHCALHHPMQQIVYCNHTQKTSISPGNINYNFICVLVSLFYLERGEKFLFICICIGLYITH